MIFRKKIVTVFVALFGIFALVTGCDDNSTGSEGDTGTMQVVLHDAPTNYQEVNVHIDRVEVNNSADSETGWVTISEPNQTYDLLELTNGATEVLGSKELEAGTYEQIRLILADDGHTVVVNDTEHDLAVPSGQQTGIKLNINAEIEPDITYTILLDFDASRSVVELGNEQSGIEYQLKPVIKATNEAITGNISGTIDPAASKPFVYAIAGADTLSSTKADTSNGEFKLIGLEEGTYTVAVDPTDDTYGQTEETGVMVTVGETTDIGTITVPQN